MPANNVNGFNILGDRGLSNENMIADVRDTGGHTHVILNNDKLTAMILIIGRRAIFRFKGTGSWDDDNAHTSSIPAHERVQVMHRMAPIGAILYLVNEPSGAYEQLATWTLEALDECNKLGRKACIFNFAVGNPSDATLELLKPVVEFAYEHGHIVGWHEYRNPADGEGYVPDGHYDIGRFLSGRRIWGVKCPEIVITELGVTVNYRDSAGYRTIWTDEQMGEAIEAWTRFYASHGVKVCHYAYGGQGDPKWDSFEVKYPAIQKSITEANQLEIEMTQPTPPEGYGRKFTGGRMVLIDATRVNFRSEPSTASAIINAFRFTGGEWVNYWENAVNGWRKVEYGGVVGFVSARYTSISGGQAVTDPPIITPLPLPDLNAPQEVRDLIANALEATAKIYRDGVKRLS